MIMCNKHMHLFWQKKSLNSIFVVVDISSSFERAQLIQNQLYVDKIIVNTLNYVNQKINVHTKKTKVIPIS